MQWLTRIISVMKVGLVALKWFEAAKADGVITLEEMTDGVITLEEMTDGVTQLLEAADLADDIRIEVDG